MDPISNDLALAPLGAGDLIDRAVRLYRRHFLTLIRIAAPPVDDAANQVLVAFFADLLRLPRRSVRIVSGQRNRLKRISIDGIRLSTLEAQLSISLNLDP